jgi:hypothetical protein
VPGTFGGRIEGTFEDELGHPLAGQTVKVSGRAGGRNVSVYTLTQPDGSYRAENLALASYRVTATVPAGYRRVITAGIPVVDGNPVSLDLVAEPR